MTAKLITVAIVTILLTSVVMAVLFTHSVSAANAIEVCMLDCN